MAHVSSPIVGRFTAAVMVTGRDVTSCPPKLAGTRYCLEPLSQQGAPCPKRQLTFQRKIKTEVIVKTEKHAGKTSSLNMKMPPYGWAHAITAHSAAAKIPTTTISKDDTCCSPPPPPPSSPPPPGPSARSERGATPVRTRSPASNHASFLVLRCSHGQGFARCLCKTY